MSVYAKPTTNEEDLAAARSFERVIEKVLPNPVSFTTSRKDLDFWVQDPGYWVEVKERSHYPAKQTRRHAMHIHPDNLMVIDELAIRKALLQAPKAWFVLGDRVFTRVFLANIVEIAMADRVRVNRDYGDYVKGKWIIDLSQFRQIPVREIPAVIEQDLKARPWLRHDGIPLGKRLPFM